MDDFTTRTAVYALTAHGAALAEALADSLCADLYVLGRYAGPRAISFDSLTALVREDTFARYPEHVFVAAAGIAVRIIAPLIVSKTSDPAVVVLDQAGRYAVSLLSGHLGGGNDLAARCAAITGGRPVITTATDVEGVPSVDVLARDRGLRLANAEAIKGVNAALLDGRAVQLHDPEGWLGVAYDPAFQAVAADVWEQGAPGVWVSWKYDCPDPAALRLYPPVLHLGVGCRKNVPGQEILEHVIRVFQENDLALESVVDLGSAEIKRNEPGILEAAAALGAGLHFFAVDALNEVAVPNPSERVEARLGAGSVAEASALLLARGGRLLVTKTKTERVTLAVAGRSAC